ncbi:transcriptional regulator with XRE-family HTH domain [Evansella vedderi]|uniref:Transcriptional regulator with XRE-family HTH domain n=1 Tax=Evansella vedderi TaxID=38282 RepID=A0ABT9ZNR7_9BACI|nr:helix-turn-helix transcriptional regulator [Evansella vedderi]MDQ0252886.1 transcriptional regulator with XRE-family HTH domain [Evansella vedderi]
MDFKSRIKRLRHKQRLTQQDLGQKINVSKVAISCYETGKRTPDTDTLKKLAEVFHVSIDYLLGASDLPIRKAENKSEKLELSHLAPKKHITAEVFLEEYVLIIDEKETNQEELLEAIHYIKARRIMKGL